MPLFDRSAGGDHALKPPFAHADRGKLRLISNQAERKKGPARSLWHWALGGQGRRNRS